MVSFDQEQPHHHHEEEEEERGGGLLSRLEQAAYSGNVAELRRVLQADRLFLDKLTSSTAPLESNPLHVAALRSHPGFVWELLCHKPALGIELDSQGSSVLHLVAAGDQEGVVKVLLRTEVGIKLCLVGDKDGLLPIHIAASRGRITILQLLFYASPGSAKMTTPRGDTIFHLAVKSNIFGVVNFLVDKMGGDGEFLNAKDDKGNNILHVAVARKQFQTIKFLLNKSSIDVNALNNSHSTPLDVLISPIQENENSHLMNILLVSGGRTAAALLAPKALPHYNSKVENSTSSPRGSNWSAHLWNVLCFFFVALGNRNLEREGQSIHKTLMTVAIFIATMTSQEGLKSSQDTLLLMVGLLTSYSIIVLLFFVNPERHKRALIFLTCLTCISVISTALAFLTALIKTHPDFYDHMSAWFRILKIFIPCSSLLITIYLFRCRKKNNIRDGQQTNFIHRSATCITKTSVICGTVFVILAVLYHALTRFSYQFHELHPTNCQSLISASGSFFKPSLLGSQVNCAAIDNYTNWCLAIKNRTPFNIFSAIHGVLDTVHQEFQSIAQNLIGSNTKVSLHGKPFYVVRRTAYSVPPT